MFAIRLRHCLRTTGWSGFHPAALGWQVESAHEPWSCSFACACTCRCTCGTRAKASISGRSAASSAAHRDPSTLVSWCRFERGGVPEGLRPSRVQLLVSLWLHIPGPGGAGCSAAPSPGQTMETTFVGSRVVRVFVCVCVFACLCVCVRACVCVCVCVCSVGECVCGCVRA